MKLEVVFSFKYLKINFNKNTIGKNTDNVSTEAKQALGRILI